MKISIFKMKFQNSYLMPLTDENKPELSNFGTHEAESAGAFC
jgi:hypothetical protein